MGYDMKRELLFSVTKNDFDVQTFKAGGKGGQHQNTTNTGVRIIHRESGAVGESREERSQPQNKKIAFRRCIETKTFQLWLKLKSSARMKGIYDIEKHLDEQMKEKNIKVETYTPEG
jgi:protein subunit release factor A